MKTIEERANDYISKVTGCECVELAGFIAHRYFKGKKISIKKRWNDIDAWEAYIAGAKEQKAIDIDKVCEWIKENVEGGVHPQSAYGFADRFRKAMEEQL